MVLNVKGKAFRLRVADNQEKQKVQKGDPFLCPLCSLWLKGSFLCGGVTPLQPG